MLAQLPVVRNKVTYNEMQKPENPDYMLMEKLLNEYHFTHYATREETYKVAEYLKEKYADFIGLNNPIINISDGDFNIYGEQSFNIHFLKKALMMSKAF